MRAAWRFLRLDGIWRACFGRLDGLRADALRLDGLRRSLGAWVGICAVVLGTLLSACDVHEFPEQHPGGDDPGHETPDPGPGPGPSPTPGDGGRVRLQLHFEPDVWLWEHLYDPKQDTREELYPDTGVDEAHPGTSLVYSNVVPTGLMDVIVKVYAAGNTQRSVADYEFRHDVAEGYDHEVEMELTPGDYDVAVWGQLLPRAAASPFYSTADFRAIHLLDALYDGNTDYRDAFAGRVQFAFTADQAELAEAADSAVCTCRVTMRRPMGKFEFVTTDLSEFLERERVRRLLSAQASVDDYRVVISYPYYYPNAYNLLSDDVASGSGYRFETRMTVTGENEASMGFDYVFIRDTRDAAVQAQVTVYDLDGNGVAQSLVVMVPMRRDHHTVLRGAFLSMGAGGGVGLDPSYEGDHNIQFH